MDILPNEAREKVEQMRLRREELSALYVSSFEGEQAVRIEIFKVKARIAELQKPRAVGGGGLDAEDIRVQTEQKRLDRASADLDRLLAARAPRDAESTLLGRLLQNIEAAIAKRPSGTIGAMVEIEVPSFKGNILDAIEGRRRRLRELEADLQRTRCAPHPSSIVKAAMRREIEALATQGAPDMSGAVENAAPISFPTQTNQVQIFNAAPGTIGFTEPQPNTIALLAWLFEAEIVQKLDTLIDECADDDEALMAEQRRERETEIERDMLATAREEIALIDHAQKQGLSVDHRLDVSVLALLGIEWAPASPPAPREDDGQADVVRHV
ncbi:hypothetical protein [Bradyrhizobium sp. USDA 4502]